MRGVLATVLVMCLPLGAVAAAGPCNAVLKWTWDGPTASPSYPYLGLNPVVVQLTDDDGNGRIDAGDGPDVVFHHYSGVPPFAGVLTALDGRSGAELFTTDPAVTVAHQGIAAADLDGDGVVELIAVHQSQRQVVVFEHTGALRWLSQPPPVPFDDREAYYPATADLDQDGRPEIYLGSSVFNADGSFRWMGAAPWVGGIARGSADGHVLPTAADLDPTRPGLELSAGNTLYDSDGAVVWSNTSIPDGWTEVADFDGDRLPEILLRTQHGAINSTVWYDVLQLLDRRGNALGPVYDPGLAVGPPAVADLDGDGLPEVVTGVGWTELHALEWQNGAFTVRWRLPRRYVVDPGQRPPSAFDFDGDGAAEVLHCDHDGCDIIDGRSGAILESIPSADVIPREHPPIVTDLDDDCHADILLSRRRAGPRDSLSAYACTAGQPARAIWNQWWYHVTNVNDDGTVPRVETPPWTASNSCLAQVASGDRVPASIGNTLLGVRARLDVVFSWVAPAGGARTYTLHRGTVKGVWPSPPFMPGLAWTGVTLNDLPWPPMLYFYRVAGANCAGVEGP